MATDSEFTKVDPDALMEAAEHGKSYVTDIEGHIEDMRRWVSIIDTLWQGTAADAYRKRLEQVLGAVEGHFEEFRMLPNILEHKAREYGYADKEAKVIASNIEQATWADVMA